MSVKCFLNFVPEADSARHVVSMGKLCGHLGVSGGGTVLRSMAHSPAFEHAKHMHARMHARTHARMHACTACIHNKHAWFGLCCAVLAHETFMHMHPQFDMIGHGAHALRARTCTACMDPGVALGCMGWEVDGSVCAVCCSEKDTSGWIDLLWRIGQWKSKNHWCKNLHRLIYRWGFTLKVHMTMVCLPVRFRQVNVEMPWPVLKFSSWVRLIFEKTSGEPLLGGHKIQDELAWREMFRSFWAKHAAAFGPHPGISAGADIDLHVPILIHGDEGRGKARKAVMVTSVQPMIHSGEKQHTYLTRYLFAVLPADNYSGDTSFDMLQDVLVEDLQECLEEGVTASRPYPFHTVFSLCETCASGMVSGMLEVSMPDLSTRTLRFPLIGVKGDWPFLSHLLAVCRTG